MQIGEVGCFLPRFNRSKCWNSLPLLNLTERFSSSEGIFELILSISIKLLRSSLPFDARFEKKILLLLISFDEQFRIISTTHLRIPFLAKEHFQNKIHDKLSNFIETIISRSVSNFVSTLGQRLHLRGPFQIPKHCLER